MQFNVTFMGPESIAHLRRDLMLLLQYALEDCGHEVTLSHQSLEQRGTNIVIGGYFMQPQHFKEIMQMGLPIIHLNSEVIKNDMMNFNPQKVDFMGSYLPFLRYGLGIWETVIDNMPELDRYGTNHAFLRWAYHEKLADVPHRQEKDLDFYFFGFLTDRRKQLLSQLIARGFKGAAHHSCPYFVRNSYIGRAKVIPNIIQKDIYTHVNCYRVGFLANNRCAILSEQENDPAGYLEYTRVCTAENFAEAFEELIRSDAYQQLADASFETFKNVHMRDIMEKALEFTFSKDAKEKKDAA